MNLTDLITLAIDFTQKWMGTTLPRILSAFLGTLICVLAATAAWDRRIRAVPTVFLMLLGLTLMAVALDPSLPYIFAAASHLAKLRVLMAVLSFVVVVITIEAIRKSHLQERYALLWVATAFIILIVAFFPKILDFMQTILGTQYITTVVGIVFTFLLLIAFHFSIALSGYQKKQTQIARRCAILEQRIEELSRALGEMDPGIDSLKLPVRSVEMASSSKAPAQPECVDRRLHGSQVVAFLVIFAAVTSVLMTGLMNPRPMVGDEVTHYYMLVEQAKDLSHPNFYARIPTGWGSTEVRRYPHPFLWHYFGAVVYRIFGKSFAAVQIYQVLFWAQLLWIAYLLAKSRQGIENRSVIIYLSVLASLPLCLIFAVTLYQDIPATAQVLTAFYFLHRRKPILATGFMCLAIGFKISMLLFLPAFLCLLFLWVLKHQAWMKSLAGMLAAGLVFMMFTASMGWAVKQYGHTGFYPQQKLSQLARRFSKIGKNSGKANPSGMNSDQHQGPQDKRGLLDPPANRPGDLRIHRNYLVYGGGVFWLVAMLGAVSLAFLRRKGNARFRHQSSAWIWGTGLSYILLTAFFVKAAPDARFFLPGLAFVLLPLSEAVVRLPRAKVIIALVATMSILQGGYVLAKTTQLRRVSPSLQAAIRFLAQHPPEPRRVFMYPEGNYRLFPVPHEWYFNYHLKEFWHAGNDRRIEMLNHFNIGAIVIKKHLVGRAEGEIVNLGIYPESFVREIASDPRFKKIFENRSVAIFKVPPADGAEHRKRDSGQ